VKNQKKAWCTGRPHSQETKNKMSKALQGRYTLDWYINKHGKIEGPIKYKSHHQKNKSK